MSYARNSPRRWAKLTNPLMLTNHSTIARGNPLGCCDVSCGFASRASQQVATKTHQPRRARCRTRTIDRQIAVLDDGDDQ